LWFGYGKYNYYIYTGTDTVNPLYKGTEHCEKELIYDIMRFLSQHNIKANTQSDCNNIHNTSFVFLALLLKFQRVNYNVTVSTARIWKVFEFCYWLNLYDFWTSGRPRPWWKDNIKMDFRETGIDGANWIRLAQDRVNWWAFVNTEMNIWIP